MYKIAVIGDRDSVYGFSALGMDTYFIKPDEEPYKLFKKLCQSENYSIIYITEALASVLEDEIEKYSDQKTPAIILIPGTTEIQGREWQLLKLLLKKLWAAIFLTINQRNDYL